MDVSPSSPTTPLQRLLSEMHELGEQRMNIEEEDPRFLRELHIRKHGMDIENEMDPEDEDDPENPIT